MRFHCLCFPLAGGLSQLCRVGEADERTQIRARDHRKPLHSGHGIGHTNVQANSCGQGNERPSCGGMERIVIFELFMNWELHLLLLNIQLFLMILEHIVSLHSTEAPAPLYRFHICISHFLMSRNHSI